MSQYDVIRFVSMMSLCLTAAPDCHTGQRKDRYCACMRRCRFGHVTLIFYIVVTFMNFFAKEGLRKKVGPKEDLIDPKTSLLSIIKQDFSPNLFPSAMAYKLE